MQSHCSYGQLNFMITVNLIFLVCPLTWITGVPYGNKFLLKVKHPQHSLEEPSIPQEKNNKISSQKGV